MIIVSTDKKAELLLSLPHLWLQLDSDLGPHFFTALVTSSQTVWAKQERRFE